MVLNNPGKLFDEQLAGLVPRSGGGTTNFLRADGTWAPASGGGIDDGDKGDVVVSDSGATWTIDNDAVTYAKMQNVSASDRVLGRQTASAGNVEEITCTADGRQLLAINGSTRGDILYYDGDQWVKLAIGDESMVLAVQDGLPTWVSFG